MEPNVLFAGDVTFNPKHVTHFETEKGFHRVFVVGGESFEIPFNTTDTLHEKKRLALQLWYPDKLEQLDKEKTHKDLIWPKKEGKECKQTKQPQYIFGCYAGKQTTHCAGKQST